MVRPVLFERRSFSQEVQAAAARDARLVTLAEIESLLLAARAQLHYKREQPDNDEIEF